jgi:hypothetical protein
VITRARGRCAGAAAGRAAGARTALYCNVIEAPWLVNGGHGASLRHQLQVRAQLEGADAERRAAERREAVRSGLIM